jgi:septation ring formation regulator EzrA|tara:strand:- start:495 stop:869 length:375 start_codon:yes stop_codon:yes gene_type:complete
MSGTRYTNILIIICMAFLAFTIFNVRGLKTDIKGFNDKIENIGKQIDSIQTVNSTLDKMISNLHAELKNIDGDIDKVKTNIYTIRRNTDEKSNTVDNLTISELQEFFTKRYDSIFKATNSKAGN